MPIYQFKCGVCGLVLDQRLPVELRHAKVECESCRSLMDRVPSVPINGFEPTRVKHRFDDQVTRNRERAEKMGY
jgi:putative FmdB family regulatory protein